MASELLADPTFATTSPKTFAPGSGTSAIVGCPAWIRHVLDRRRPGLVLAVAGLLNGGVPPAWLPRSCEHATWNGFTFMDLIFPLFVLPCRGLYARSRWQTLARGIALHNCIGTPPSPRLCWCY